jgi:glycosyltransferase involved in cell wall biosynthesis
VKEKGYFEMANIFKKLISYDKNYVWIIVGDGIDLDNFKNYIRDLELDKFIIFEGAKNREELRYYYSNVDIFWLLSNFDESFGLVYLEAQACGCPAIGKNKAGVKEAASDRESGFLINSEDEVLEILKDKKYLELKQDDILSFTSNFCLDKQVKIFEKFI